MREDQIYLITYQTQVVGKTLPAIISLSCQSETAVDEKFIYTAMHRVIFDGCALFVFVN